MRSHLILSAFFLFSLCSRAALLDQNLNVFQNDKEGISRLYSESELKDAKKDFSSKKVLDQFNETLSDWLPSYVDKALHQSDLPPLSMGLLVDKLLNEFSSELFSEDLKIKVQEKKPIPQRELQRLIRGLRRLFIVARSEGAIDDIFLRIAFEYLKTHSLGKPSQKGFPLSLPDYYRARLNLTKHRFNPPRERDLSYLKENSIFDREQFKVKIPGVSGSFSPRERLYAEYTFPQMKKLAWILNKTVERFESEALLRLQPDSEVKSLTQDELKAVGNALGMSQEELAGIQNSVLILDRKVAETVELSPMDTYRLILNLFYKELEEAQYDWPLSDAVAKGIRPNSLDVVAAAYEFGAIQATEIGSVLNFPGFYNPEKSSFWKFASILKHAGKVGLGAVSPFAVFPVVLIEAWMASKKTPPPQHDANLIWMRRGNE